MASLSKLLKKEKSTSKISVRRENGNAFIGYACGNKLGNKSGFIEINTKRNDRKWNRNFFKLRMLLVVYNIINGTI